LSIQYITAMVRIFSTAAVVLAFSSSAYGVTEEEIQVARACRRTCETFREESSSSPACGKWMRTLPRPKVGRSCTDAFDTMFKSTCLNMCNGQEVTVDVHGACDHQRKEMPKPVVGRACNEGYEGGYETAKALFSDEAAEEREAAKREKEAAERAEMEAAHAAAEAEAAVEEKNPAAEEQVEQQQQPPAEEEGGLRGAVEEVVEEVRKVIATLPVTVDESDINLVIYEGQQPAEAVDAFCKKHMASAGTACMDQLLPHVEKKISDKL
jgi:hypothetical protein